MLPFEIGPVVPDGLFHLPVQDEQPKEIGNRHEGYGEHGEIPDDGGVSEGGDENAAT